MKTLRICFFIGVCFIMKGASETIKCYVCDNCDVLGDSQLRTCPLQDTTNSPTTKKPTTVFSQSTTQPTEEPASRSTKSPFETTSTTILPKPTQIVTDHPTKITEEPITEAPKTETTTVRTEETEPTDPNRPITNEADQVALPSSSETQVPTGDIEYSTNVIPEVLKPLETESSKITTEKTDPVEETGPFIVVSPIMTTDSPEVFSAVTVAPETLASMINFPHVGQATSHPFKPEAVNPVSVEPQVFQYTQPYQVINRIERGVRNSRSAPSYHCYSIDILDGDTKKVKKGCIEVPEEKAACEVLKNELGQSIDKCKICTEDKCNNCSALNYSVMTLVMVLFVSLF